MDEFTLKHLANWIKSRFCDNRDEIFALFIEYFNQLDESDKDYILNNSWEVLERGVRENKAKQLERLEFGD